MPAVLLDDQRVDYEIRRSSRSKRIRITVRPGRVLVTAPRFTLRRTIVGFVESKRHWIFDKVTKLSDRAVAATPERFVSGAKILFRGRNLRLRVEEGGTPETVRFANGFQVTVPVGLSPEVREQKVRRLVMSWLEQRALDDAYGWSRKHGSRLGVQPARIRLGNQRSIWGSCSARGVIALNWRLITTPKPIFEYVVVHELCHLIEHNHGRRFWSLVESRIPDYRERRAWLKRHGVALA
jgi:predicted metal-dependent hydrolase